MYLTVVVVCCRSMDSARISKIPVFIIIRIRFIYIFFFSCCCRLLSFEGFSTNFKNPTPDFFNSWVHATAQHTPRIFNIHLISFWHFWHEFDNFNLFTYFNIIDIFTWIWHLFFPIFTYWRPTLQDVKLHYI